MEIAALIMALLLPLLMGAAFVWGRYLSRRQSLREELSPVTRQHIELFQGGQLNEAAVESAKARFRDLLERGEVEAVETCMRAGTHYVVQVRALAELGTDDAGRILERQLKRRLTDDQIEQSWYWIDLANGLRSLNRSQCLPQLLQCSVFAGELPLGHFFAAETVCFLEFASYLRDLESNLGRNALLVLHRALEGLRCGVPPQVMIEGRIGELVEEVWDHRPDRVDPLVVRVLLEALRVLNRAPHSEVVLEADHSEQEAFLLQISRLAALEPAMTDYLKEAPAEMSRLLRNVPMEEHRDWLLSLTDLRAETAEVVLPLLDVPNYPFRELAVDALTWSHDDRVGPALRDWVRQQIPLAQRTARHQKRWMPRNDSIPKGILYQAVLRALRGHPSLQTETLLLLALSDWDPAIRGSALSSLGWWEPIRRMEVLHTLHEARRDQNAEVRQAARAALARLGERQALQWFRQGLTSEDVHRVHETIQLVAAESLTLLWPDVDRLADSEDLEISHHAREALERMGEDLGRR